MYNLQNSAYGEAALALFNKGYNCAQSVFLAFRPLYGLEEEQAAALASSFGAGLGRLRQVCGALSGGAMVLGILLGGYKPGDDAAKAAHYALVQRLAKAFEQANGSIICSKLLQGINTDTSPNPQPRTTEYYKKRPCGQICYTAAALVEGILREKGAIK